MPMTRRDSTGARPSGRALMAILLPACGCAVQWNLDYPDAVKRAQTVQRPLLLYFKDWSSSHHRNMVVNVFESPVVARELQDTVNVELLYNWGPEAERYNIRTAQVCVFCAPDGTEIDRMYVNPPPAPEKFADWLRACKQRLAPAATQPAK